MMGLAGSSVVRWRIGIPDKSFEYIFLNNTALWLGERFEGLFSIKTEHHMPCGRVVRERSWKPLVWQGLQVRILCTAPYGEVSPMVRHWFVAPAIRVRSPYLTPFEYNNKLNICWVSMRFWQVSVDEKRGNKSKREPKVIAVNPPGAINYFKYGIE